MPDERKKIRLEPPRYLGRNIYFLTFCCERRQRVFVDAASAASVVAILRKVSESTAFLVHGYCVMPDHLHLVLEGARDDSDMKRFRKTFKQMTSFHCRSELDERLWQKAFYDHILRASDSLDKVLWYAWMNPVRAGLCADPHDYAHSGSFTMDWGGKALSQLGWVPPWKDLRAE